MGCETITVKDLGRVFIPGCMGAAVYGKRRCTCYTRNRRKLDPSEMIQELLKENADLKQQLKKLSPTRGAS